jgi:hypothetical protein
MSRREPAMAPRYAALTRDWTARRIGLARELDEAATEGALDRLGRLRNLSDSFSTLAADARAARDTGALMRTATRLYRWRLEMMRGRS